MARVPGTRAERTFVDDEGVRWRVEEVEAAHVPGARGAACLVFHRGDRGDHWHRLWDYPREWAGLPEVELLELCQRR